MPPSVSTATEAARPGLEHLAVLRPHAAAAAEPEQGRFGGVMERAQHPGHVAERRAFDTAFAHRPRRLTLEIDDHEVLAGKEHLTEVIVAVDPCARAAQLAVQDRPEAPEDLALVPQDALGHRPRALGQVLQTAPEGVEGLAGKASQ